MAFGDGLSRFSSISIALIILTFVLMPLVHSSRSCKFKIIPFFLSLVQVRILCVCLASLNIRFTNMACNLIMFAMHETTVAAGNRARASAQVMQKDATFSPIQSLKAKTFMSFLGFQACSFDGFSLFGPLFLNFFFFGS
jgi:hypothetical protein